MARVKYDVKGVEGSGNFEAPTPGVYKAKVTQADVTKPEGKDRRIEVVYQIVDGDFKGAKLYDYVNLVSEGAKFRLRDFVDALGLKETGTLDTDKIVDEEVQIRVRNETYEGERRAKVAQVLPLGDDEGSDDEDLDDDGGDGADSEDQSYADMALAELREECDDRGISSKGSKKALIARLEADDAEADDEDGDDGEDDDGAEPDGDDDGDGDDDYDEWSIEDLKAELESRGLKTAGRKSALVARLNADDEE